MGHVLARLKNVAFEDISAILKRDKEVHVKEGLFLEHIWQNAEDRSEVFFLFRANDLRHVKEYIDGLHTEALREDPKANLPVMIYLK
jgi:hypothetical protein